MDFTIWPDPEEPSDSSSLGWAYFWSESGIKNSGNWWKWWDWNTLRDMANGKMNAFVSNILNRLKEQNVFKQISDNLEMK
jgi:hypothetical protein